MRRRAVREQGVGGPKVRAGGRLRPGPIGVELVERGASHVRGRQEERANGDDKNKVYFCHPHGSELRPILLGEFLYFAGKLIFREKG